MPARYRSWLIRIPPPLLFVAAFLGGLYLDSLVPALIVARAPVLLAVGWLLLAVGILFGPGNALSFVARGTTLIPGRQPSTLVTRGAYRFSRNPMYLGVILIYAALALIMGRLGPLVLLPLPVWALNAVIIPMEESHLAAAFGEAYSAYCARVRRWL